LSKLAGHADRTAGVFANTDSREVGGDRRAGAGARTARIAGEIVGVLGFAAGGRIAKPGGGEIGQSRLAEDDRAGRFELGNKRRVLLWNIALDGD